MALVTQNTSLITVIGEVNNLITSVTGRIPAQPAGERLLDVITRAGGLRDQGQDNWVTLERHGRRATVPFGALIYEPGNNIWAWPGDTIYIYKEPQTFLAFGATGQQGQFQFSAGPLASSFRMTLAEGVRPPAACLTCRPIQDRCSSTGVNRVNSPRSSGSIVRRWKARPCR